jgi:hypothetical protein
LALLVVLVGENGQRATCHLCFISNKFIFSRLVPFSDEQCISRHPCLSGYQFGRRNICAGGDSMNVTATAGTCSCPRKRDTPFSKLTYQFCCSFASLILCCRWGPIACVCHSKRGGTCESCGRLHCTPIFQCFSRVLSVEEAST